MLPNKLSIDYRKNLSVEVKGDRKVYIVWNNKAEHKKKRKQHKLKLFFCIVLQCVFPFYPSRMWYNIFNTLSKLL